MLFLTLGFGILVLLHDAECYLPDQLFRDSCLLVDIFICDAVNGIYLFSCRVPLSSKISPLVACPGIVNGSGGDPFDFHDESICT